MSRKLDRFFAMLELAWTWFVYALSVIAVLALYASMSGCAEMQAVRAGVASHGAQAMDQALDDAKWVTCQAASIGALERELGGDAERMAGWMLYCGKRPGKTPIAPLEAPTVPQSGFAPSPMLKSL